MGFEIKYFKRVTDIKDNDKEFKETMLEFGVNI